MEMEACIYGGGTCPIRPNEASQLDVMVDESFEYIEDGDITLEGAYVRPRFSQYLNMAQVLTEDRQCNNSQRS